MLSLILFSLPVLALVDLIVVWAALRQANVEIEAGDVQDDVMGKLGRNLSIFLSGLFVALFVIYYLLTRNPWIAFGTAAVVGLLNTLIVFLFYTLMSRR